MKILCLAFLKKTKHYKNLYGGKVEFVKIDIKTKCDFVGCKNLASLAYLVPNDKKKKMCFCDDCAKEMYLAFAKTVTPKAPKTPFKKTYK